jgi:hypothetical protein
VLDSLIFFLPPYLPTFLLEVVERGGCIKVKIQKSTYPPISQKVDTRVGRWEAPLLDPKKANGIKHLAPPALGWELAPRWEVTFLEKK